MKPDYEPMPQVLTDYLHYLLFVKNRSEKTVYEYGLNLMEFSKFVYARKSDQDPDETVVKHLTADFYAGLSLTDANQYLTEYCIYEKKNGTAIRARKVVAIRQFYLYLVNHDLIKENPMHGLEAPKTQKAQPKYLTLDQSEKLLRAIDGKYRERDYAIITLFLNCGMRLSELVGINIGDIRDDHSLVITGKGNKQRTIYLNEACQNAVDRYLAVRPHDGVKDKKALFLSNRLTRISNRSVQDIVYKFLERSGLGDRGLSVHKLRHTAATLMYQYGDVDVLVLKDVLGHENLDTTSIYTHTVAKQVREAIEHNPLADEGIRQAEDDSPTDSE